MIQSLRVRAPRVVEVVERAVNERHIPGAVMGVAKLSGPDAFWVEAIGSRRIQPTEELVTADTWFDLASLTKVLGTTLSVFRAIERRWMRLETTLAEAFPGQATRAWHHEIQLGHLLAHTSGYVAFDEVWKSLRKLPCESRKSALFEHLLELVPAHPVGTQVVYSDIGFLWLGFWLESATGRELDALWAELWDELGIEGFGVRKTDAQGWPASEERNSVASTEAVFDSLHQSSSGFIEGAVHDPTAYVLGGVAGHAGMFGTAESVLQLAQRIQTGTVGMYGFPGIQRTLLKRMLSPAGSEFSPSEGMRCFGWDRPSVTGSSAGSLFSKNSAGHLGFTGTSLWMDLDRGISAVLLTNRVHFGRDALGIRELRPLFHDAVIQSFA